MTDDESAYQALISRDSRFDGLFYTGVISTGIYCRPVCPARKPLRKNCRFFRYAEQAEDAGFRPCLRCRPELAPGAAPVDQPALFCQQLIAIIESGLADEEFQLSQLADALQLSERQLRRLTVQQLGITPQTLRQSRRLRLARQLLSETLLPVTTVAFASGFGSLRQFNAVFRQRYELTPSDFRQRSVSQLPLGVEGTLSLRLSYRPPYDWALLLTFLEKRRIKEVEWIHDNHYLRTVAIAGHQGWVRVGHHPQQQCLRVELSQSLIPVIPALLQRLRQLFDTSSSPDSIAGHLAKDPLLGSTLQRHPGIRVAGCFDPFELALRAILGQQVTVAAATTLSRRLACRFGRPISTPFAELSRLAPVAADFSGATADDLGSLGIVGSRIKAILALAGADRENFFQQLQGQSIEQQQAALVALPGIGPWTAQYIVMRAFSRTDAFPKEDIALRKALGGISSREAEAFSRRWSPWRSYAVMLLWHSSE